jgi:HAD superfamily hydrolase (TIGR01549 family)
VSAHTGDKASAVLLDIDGTLVDSTYHHALAWHRAFARVGEPPPLWRLHRAIGMGGDKLVAAVGGDETEERLGDDLRDFWKQEYAEVRAEVRPLPGAAELVQTLAADGFRIALASSGDPAFAHEAVELLGIGDLVEVLTTAEDVEASKPEPDLLGVTLERLGGIERAVFIGDTPYDVEAAERAGLKCAGVLTGGFSQAELEDAGAAAVEESPADLIATDWAALMSARRQ